MPADVGKVIWVSTDLWKRLKTRALDEGKTLRETTELAIERGLALSGAPEGPAKETGARI